MLDTEYIIKMCCLSKSQEITETAILAIGRNVCSISSHFKRTSPFNKQYTAEEENQDFKFTVHIFTQYI